MRADAEVGCNGMGMVVGGGFEREGPAVIVYVLAARWRIRYRYHGVPGLAICLDDIEAPVGLLS